jgi:hypothetical protein
MVDRKRSPEKEGSGFSHCDVLQISAGLSRKMKLGFCLEMDLNHFHGD